MKTLKRISFGCLIIMLGVLATATVVEKVSGTAVAREWFYGNIGFVALWAVIAVTGLAYILARRMWKRFTVFLLHLSLLVILLGAGITWFTAVKGKMQVPQEKAVNVFTTTDGKQHRDCANCGAHEERVRQTEILYGEPRRNRDGEGVQRETQRYEKDIYH